MLDLYDYYMFVEDRHSIWEQRQRGDGLWTTDDPILAAHKFTNVFRILDPGTQFILTDLLDPDPVEQFVRIFLYRHIGRIPAWRRFAAEVGRYPLISDLIDGTVFEVFDQYRSEGNPVFLSAYLVRPNTGAPYEGEREDKLKTVIDRTLRFTEVATEVADDLVGYPDEQFRRITSTPNVGDFFGMQTLADFWYTPVGGGDFENDFIVAGPGAVRGAKHLRPGMWPTDLIHYLRDRFKFGSAPKLELDLGGGEVRRPSLMDVQNTLCEWGKYVRIYDKGPKPVPYRPAHPGRQTPPVFPAHWKGQDL